MRRATVASLVTLLVFFFATRVPQAEEPLDVPEAPGAEVSLQRMVEGNERFVLEKLRPHHFREERIHLVGAQHPYAIILGCSDSRVPPVLLFDETLGSFFTVSVAGNVVGGHELGSIEYAAVHLGTHLLVVLGHDSCGAVTAALSAPEPSKVESRNVGCLLEDIWPALQRARKCEPAARVRTAVEDNVRLQMQRVLDRSEIVRELAKKGRLRIVGAIYHLDSGRVEFLKP